MVGLLLVSCVAPPPDTDSRASLRQKAEGSTSPYGRSYRTRTPEEQAASALPQGLRTGNSDSILLAQRMLLLPIINNALNTHFHLHGQHPDTFAGFLPFLAVWPLTPSGDGWPVTTLDEPVWPAVRVIARSDVQPFDVLLEAGDWDAAASSPVRDFFSPEWAAETGAHLRRQDFRGHDPRIDTLACNLLLPIAYHRVLTGRYTDAPSDVYTTLRMGLITPHLETLETLYPRMVFYIKQDHSACGLLLDGSNIHPRLLLFHDTLDGNSATIVPWGHSEPAQQQINHKLAQMQFWADWSDLADIPRVSQPQLSAGIKHAPARQQPERADPETAEEVSTPSA